MEIKSMKVLFSRLFPRKLDNNYSGNKLALWVFLPLTALTLWRSQHHILAPDGGAQSIATIPLDNYPNGASETVIGIFAFWGLSQLIIGLLYVIALLRYRSTVPLLYLLLIVEYAGRALIMAWKPIETSGSAPGAVANIPFIIAGTLMLTLSLWGPNATQEN